MLSKVYDSVELPANVPGIGYTLKHRNAVQALIEHYCKKAIGKIDGNGVPFTHKDYTVMVNRGKCHDMDKLLMSLSYPQLTADYLHRLMNAHHNESIVESRFCTKYDYMEMIFDCESARYTKPDKGKCAYDVFTSFKQSLYKDVRPYLELFGFTKSVGADDVIQDIALSVRKPVTEEDLVNAIISYMHTTRLHRLQYLSRVDDRGHIEMYGKSPYARHVATDVKRGGKLVFQRPSVPETQSRSLSDRAFIHGRVEVQKFDLDRLCMLTVEQLQEVENAYKVRCKELSEQRKQR